MCICQTHNSTHVDRSVFSGPRRGLRTELVGEASAGRSSPTRLLQPGHARMRRMGAQTGGCGSGGEVNEGGRVNKFFDY